MSASFEQKLLLLKRINESKLILFSKFDEQVTNSDKQKEWRKIRDYGLSIGICSLSSKSWNYIRDAMWPNIRKLTLNKVDKCRKSGASESAYTEVDLAVLDILGKESPPLQAFDFEESTRTRSPASDFTEKLQYTEVGETSIKDVQNMFKAIRKRRFVDQEGPSFAEAPIKLASKPSIDELKEEKLTLQIQYYRAQNEVAALTKRKLELEIENLERSMVIEFKQE